jgi:hypothetical protein
VLKITPIEKSTPPEAEALAAHLIELRSAGLISRNDLAVQDRAVDLQLLLRPGGKGNQLRRPKR